MLNTRLEIGNIRLSINLGLASRGHPKTLVSLSLSHARTHARRRRQRAPPQPRRPYAGGSPSLALLSRTPTIYAAAVGSLVLSFTL